MSIRSLCGIMVSLSLCAAVAPAQDSADDKLLASIEQVYTLSSTAKSAAEFSQVITACEQLLAGELSDKHRDYLADLASWSHNRRGAIRLELAKQFSRVNNVEQATEARRLAREDFDASLSYDPTRWRALLNRGVVGAEEDNFAAAIEDFGAVIRLRPQTTDAWFNRAELNYALRNYEIAMADYDRVLEESPGDLQALTGRSHCLVELGKFEQALADYEAVLKMKPRSAWALANRADAYQMVGNWKQAYEDYSRALEISSVGGIYQRLAWMLATCPDVEIFSPETARDLAQQAIDLDGETATNLDTLATALAATGDFDSARQYQSRALALAEGPKTELQERQAMFERKEVYQQKGRRR